MRNLIFIVGLVSSLGLKAELSAPNTQLVVLLSGGDLVGYSVKYCESEGPLAGKEQGCTPQFKLDSLGNATFKLREETKAIDVDLIVEGKVVATLDHVQVGTVIIATKGKASYYQYPAKTRLDATWAIGDDDKDDEKIEDKKIDSAVTIKRSDIKRIIRNLKKILKRSAG